MAVLSKIRERSMFLIIIIGLALFAFVLDPSTLGDFFNSSKVNEIGEVNGESISRQEFAAELDSYKQQRGGRVSEMQASKAVWNNILRKKIYKNQLEKAGISLGEADVWKELINISSIKNSPKYLNEAGLFDETKFKQFLADTKENNPQLWPSWSNYINQIKINAERNAYNNLITAGLGASLKEGEADYFINNTKLNAQFVFIPYATVADSLVKVTNKDIEKYIKENEFDFKVEESRDISYVKFDITATLEDENAIKNEVFKLLDDSLDRNNETVVGLKNATNYKEFLNENESDINLDENFKFKKDIASSISEKVFAGSKGDVFGPYKDKGFFKISKITVISKKSDSVKASHILIPFVGSQSASKETTKTEELAKKTIDSIYNLVKRSKTKFTEIANQVNPDGTKGKGGEIGWVNYSAAFSPSFDSDFAAYMFNNKKGDIEIVKTKFGFHIIRIDDKKNEQKVVKLATYGRKIIPSEATENVIFQKAEQFALELSKERNFTEVAKENKYLIKPAVGLKVLDENVPGLGNQRQIINWAFGGDVKIGDFKRFDLEGSHIVATVSSKVEKGLSPVNKASARVKPILKNRKRAKIIEEKLNGSTLKEIAKSNNSSVKNGSNVTLKSPTLSGAGFEPKIVGAMYNAELNKVYKGLEGNRGVYAFVVTNKELPRALPNYESSRKKIAQSRKGLTYRIFESIKKATDIEDYRADMYVSN